MKSQFDPVSSEDVRNLTLALSKLYKEMHAVTERAIELSESIQRMSHNAQMLEIRVAKLEGRQSNAVN